MLEIEKKADCCGCYACYNICPKKCISMETDEEGFWYPKINKSDCINCNLCEKVCPIINTSKEESFVRKAYAVINLNEKIRLESSSGGIFTLLAENVIKQNGIIYGAAFDKDFDVRHIRISTLGEISLLRGSKYVQSSIGETYSQAKKDLLDSKLVLFTGTPCQIEGLKSFLQKDYENLILVDIICHGVPSPLVWHKYLISLMKKYNSQIKNISFRSKVSGWKSYSVKIDFRDNIYVKKGFDNEYIKGFLKDIFLRPSCYQCKFKKINRASDVTIADFWGVNSLLPSMDDDKGTSLVIIHSKKGDSLFDKLQNKVKAVEVDIEEAIKYNPSMIKSVLYNKKRDYFFKTLNYNRDVYINKLICEYTKLSFAVRIKQKLKRVLKRLLCK